jgi:hypothetical protein
MASAADGPPGAEDPAGGGFAAGWGDRDDGQDPGPRRLFLEDIAVRCHLVAGSASLSSPLPATLRFQPA